MIEIFNKYDLMKSRIISYSKSAYMIRYPYNTVVFNANVFIYDETNNRFEKVWYGDLDLNFDSKKLLEISKELNQKLYVLREMDGRFENETTQNVNYKSIWTTDDYEIKPISKNMFKLLSKNDKLQRKINNQKTKERNKNYKKYNKNLPIVQKYIEDNFLYEIEIPYTDMEKKLDEFKLKILSFINEDVNRYIYLDDFKDSLIKEKGYFSAYYLEEFLLDKLNLTELNPSDVWLTKKTNKKLRELDIEYERFLNSYFSKKNIRRDITCNFCVFYISHLNNEGVNLKTFSDDYLYIRK